MILMFVFLRSCHIEMTSSDQLLSSLVLNSSKSRRVSSVNTSLSSVSGYKLRIFQPQPMNADLYK